MKLRWLEGSTPTGRKTKQKENPHHHHHHHHHHLLYLHHFILQYVSRGTCSKLVKVRELTALLAASHPLAALPAAGANMATVDIELQTNRRKYGRNKQSNPDESWVLSSQEVNLPKGILVFEVLSAF